MKREFLRRLRRARYLTQKRAAAKSGITQQAWNAWEDGRYKGGMRVDVLLMIADGLNADPMELLREEARYLIAREAKR